MASLGAIDHRAHALIALGQIGPPEAVIPALCEAAGAKEPLLALVALETLASLRPASEAALRELSHHPDEQIRAWVASELKEPETPTSSK
jgi:hypothetical protein